MLSIVIIPCIRIITLVPNILSHTREVYNQTNENPKQIKMFFQGRYLMFFVIISFKGLPIMKD